MLAYFLENGQPESQARKAFAHYDNHNWTDSRGNAVKNWKQKVQTNWFTEAPAVPKPTSEEDGDKKMHELIQKGFKNLSPEQLRWVYEWQHRTSWSYTKYPDNIRLVKATSSMTKQDCIDADRAAGFFN